MGLDYCSGVGDHWTRLDDLFSGVFQGAEEVSENPAVEEATEEAKQFVRNATSD